MSLLHAFPPAWRRRYGQELGALLEELEADGRLSWRVRLDVLRSALRERLRLLGSNAPEPGERAREGSLLVLYAWTAFLLGGLGVEKASEHWQAVTPSGVRVLPTAAFDCLLAAAVAGSALVVLAVGLALPRLVALLRDGGWPGIRRPILRACGLSLTGLVATAALASWAHSLSPAARNGADPSYEGAFAAWALLFAACLLAWALAAARTARELSFTPGLLRLCARLGGGVALAMAVMTAAAATWWGLLASRAPWFFDGRAVGTTHAPVLEPNILAPMLLMAVAAVFGLVGASRAARAGGELGPSR